MTVGDLLTMALGEIGVTASGETPPAEDSAHALSAFNNWVDQLKSEELTIYARTRATGTMTANAPSFTVGTGGVLLPSTVRPPYIDAVGYIDVSGSEIALPLLNEAAYQAIVLKSMTAAAPWSAYYNPTWPTGTLRPFPIPTVSLTWVLYFPAEVEEFVLLTDAVSLPAGYRQMFVKGLALQLCPSYERDPNPLLVEQAREAKADVKRSNRRELLVSFDGAALVSNGGGIYNINSDQGG